LPRKRSLLLRHEQIQSLVKIKEGRKEKSANGKKEGPDGEKESHARAKEGIVSEKEGYAREKEE